MENKNIGGEIGGERKKKTGGGELREV